MEAERVGSVLHGAYGDYYEQMVALRQFKLDNPRSRLVLYYANDLRMQEMSVFDHSYADEVYPRTALTSVPVDRFYQFQVRDGELREEVLSRLPGEVLAKFDLRRNLKPWHSVRRAWRRNAELCDIPLSELGKARLPTVVRSNNIPANLFDERPTIGFLWRYRNPGGAISSRGQAPAAQLLEERSKLFRQLISDSGCHILACGLGVPTTDENRDRTDNKYESRLLDLPADSVTYLQGLSWGLELEILRRCSLCIVMVSGFSEALWLKRRGAGIVAVDTPRHYLLKAIWNRVPFFGIRGIRELMFQLRQPHTSDKVYSHLKCKRLWPLPRS